MRECADADEMTWWNAMPVKMAFRTRSQQAPNKRLVLVNRSMSGNTNCATQSRKCQCEDQWAALHRPMITVRRCSNAHVRRPMAARKLKTITNVQIMATAPPQISQYGR
jgi:hypothetical protein